jgi:hypothetical protein
MVDDRDVADLLTAAVEHGVKVVQIGDWAQLKAIGVGGGFKRVHEIVNGLELSENRRQKDAVERAALEAWLDGGRRTALSRLAEHGRVHAVRTPDEAYAAMLGAWKDTVDRLEGDVHDQLEETLSGSPPATPTSRSSTSAPASYALEMPAWWYPSVLLYAAGRASHQPGGSKSALPDPFGRTSDGIFTCLYFGSCLVSTCTE